MILSAATQILYNQTPVVKVVCNGQTIWPSSPTAQLGINTNMWGVRVNVYRNGSQVLHTAYTSNTAMTVNVGDTVELESIGYFTWNERLESHIDPQPFYSSFSSLDNTGFTGSGWIESAGTYYENFCNSYTASGVVTGDTTLDWHETEAPIYAVYATDSRYRYGSATLSAKLQSAYYEMLGPNGTYNGSSYFMSGGKFRPIVVSRVSATATIEQSGSADWWDNDQKLTAGDKVIGTVSGYFMAMDGNKTASASAVSYTAGTAPQSAGTTVFSGMRTAYTAYASGYSSIPSLSVSTYPTDIPYWDLSQTHFSYTAAMKRYTR